MKKFILADCNNFYVSCEKIFNPSLNNKPVVVLSSNDACVIARSNEAKKLGIKMGDPAFECKEIFEKHNVIVYSANFTLYGDISKRVMQTLSSFATDIEIYSVDEAFLFLSNHNSQFEKDENYHANYCRYIRIETKQRIGIPISFGIGQTKTLAKIATDLAKKDPTGVFDISIVKNIDDILSKIDVADIWGIGYRYSRMLKNKNILTARDFKYLKDDWVRKNMTIMGLRTLLELRGTPCFKLNDIIENKQSITVSRLFGRPVKNITELKQAAASYTVCAAQKLRQQKSIAGSINVFVVTTRYHDPQRYYDATFIELPIATSYTPDLIKAVHSCIKKLFRPGLIYKKTGIILTDIVDENCRQLNLYEPLPDTTTQSHLMKIIDSANNKLGKNKVTFAAAGIEQEWKMKQLKKSACFTTNWHEIKIVT
ncbi:Y-family DNA polymerase [Candidatus Dependentiae bacterium]|nr:Y-family DNA polymerase [Candidatus Dependentiae bacterium]